MVKKIEKIIIFYSPSKNIDNVKKWKLKILEIQSMF